MVKAVGSTPMLNLSTRELDRARLKLRDDLIVRPLPGTEGVTYQIEDPAAVRFYRVGKAEYLLISLLDGRTTLAEAVTTSARELGREAFSEHEATSICLWLVDTGLATPTEGTIDTSGPPTPATSSFFNPFWMKVPLLQPERLLDLLLPVFRWLFTGPALLGMVLLWIAAGVVIAGHADAFLNDAREIFSPHNWLMLGTVWVGLKIVHEFGHGLCCRAHGGRVTEMGLVLVLLAPMAYVDVTSTWAFRSRWKRMHVAAAGILIELTIAAIAALLWTQASDSFSKHLLYNVVVSASLTTLIFNINPLMRFDGYYILKDLLDLPNLGATSQKWLQSKLSRFFYGEQRSVPLPAGLAGGVLRCYAVLSTAWRVTVSASLLAGAAVMFHGAGLALAIGAIVLWYVKPAIEWLWSLIQRFRRDRWSAVRAVILGSTTAAALGALIFVLPSPFQRYAPGVVDYADLEIVRVTSPGFVQEIHVTSGQMVAAGTPLISLRNEDLTAKVTDLELAIEQSEARRIGLVNRRELGAAQIEQRNQQALSEQLTEARTRSDALVLRAPVSGRVLARELPHQIGNYVKEGTEIVVIGDDAHKEVLASVDQRDLESFSHQGEITHLRLIGSGAPMIVEPALQPRASTRLPHPSLSAVHGGQVDVVASSDDDGGHGVRLSEPRFLLRVPLGPAESPAAFAGQYAVTSPSKSQQTIARQLMTSMRDWGRELVDPR